MLDDPERVAEEHAGVATSAGIRAAVLTSL
jgi:hypothetical protein